MTAAESMPVRSMACNWSTWHTRSFLFVVKDRRWEDVLLCWQFIAVERARLMGMGSISR
jgi:hypothetical protein